MEETSIYVNNKLKEGYSIAKVERELNFGKDTLRKKLNRANYKYNKTLNQFILDDNTNITQNVARTEKNIIENPKSNKNEVNTNIGYTENNVITNSITHKMTHKEIGINNDIASAEESYITQIDNTDITQPLSPRSFTDEDFNILFAVIDNYKSKQKDIVIHNDDSEITTRSFRSYKSVFDSFSEYCKSNNLNQKDAVADALMSYMSK